MVDDWARTLPAQPNGELRQQAKLMGGLVKGVEARGMSLSAVSQPYKIYSMSFVAFEIVRALK